MALNSTLKYVLTSAMILGLFGLVGTGSVALVNALTQERIANNQTAMRLARLHEVLPEERFDNEILSDTVVLPAGMLCRGNETIIYRARKNGEPVAAVFQATTPDGYSGNITLLVSVGMDGKVLGVRPLEHKETPGLGDAIEASRSDWILSFNGRSLEDPKLRGWAVKKDGGQFDQFTGATITPRAVVNVVKQVLLYFNSKKDEIFAEQSDV